MANTQGPGEEKLRQVLRRHRDRARQRDPTPYDNDWGWWIEYRVKQLEKRTNWLIALAAGILVAEIVRLGLAAFGVLP